MTRTASWPQAKVVKCRPIASPPGHLGDEQWCGVLESNGWGFDGNSIRLRYPSAGSYPAFDGWLSETLQEVLGTGCALLVLDACCDAKPVLNFILESICRVLCDTDLGSTQVLVVTNRSGIDADAIFQEAKDGGYLNGRVWALTASGHLVGQDSQQLEGVARALRPLISPDSPSVWLRTLQSHTLRERGVFTDSARPEGLYFRFRYLIEKDGLQPAAQLLKQYVDRNEITTVLYDTSSSAWLSGVMTCFRAFGKDVAIVDGTHRPSDGNEQLSLGESDRLLLLCGATRGGDTAARLCRDLAIDAATLSGRIFRLAFFCDPGERSVASVPSTAWRRVEYENGSFDFFTRVELSQRASTSWQVKAARRLGEVRDLGVGPSAGLGEIDKITRVGLWDLFAVLKAVDEREIYEGSSFSWRDPHYGVRYLPDLRRIDDPRTEQRGTPADSLDYYEANWLAEAMVQRFCEVTGESSRDRLVVIVPQAVVEGSGGEKVLQSMLRTRRVRALRVPREPGAVGDVRIKACQGLWSGFAFVVFDETAVTMSTLTSIVNALADQDISVRAAGVLIHAGSPQCEFEPNFFSLACWSPATLNDGIRDGLRG